jgi:hypothetical protein
MARSDLLVNLVKAGVSGDARTLKRTVEAIVAEERAKQHNVLADRLARVVEGEGAQMNGMSNVVRAQQEAPRGPREFLAEIMPRRRIEELVLPELTRLGAEQLSRSSNGRAFFVRIRLSHAIVFCSSGRLVTAKQHWRKRLRKVSLYRSSLCGMKQ